ncbi:MAG: Fe-S protein assembly co-chaperone HscB [Dongiaceae bacterium]
MNDTAADRTSARSGAGSGASIGSCWSCHGPVDPVALFCHVCGAIQPPGPADHFKRLGLTPRFDLDPAEIGRRYVAFQQRLHPDRFAGKSARERALAEQHAVSLNEAHETLKDPLRRGSYLLQLAGRTSPTAENRTIDDPALLMETMERREALSEAASIDAVAVLAAAAASDESALLDALKAAFVADDLDEASDLLTRLRYLRKFAEEARARRAVLAEAAP